MDKPSIKATEKENIFVVLARACTALRANGKGDVASLIRAESVYICKRAEIWALIKEHVNIN